MLRIMTLLLALLLALPSVAQQSSGTGFAIAPGLVVTNQHVVAGCTSLAIVLPGQERRPARLIADDADVDLALIYALGLPGSIASIRSTPVRLGEQVYAFGFPLAGALASSGNFTSGLVSALRGLGDRQGELQFSAPIQPGNSGGALLDRSGLVIGVVQSKLDVIRAARITGDIAQNVNFAVGGDALTAFLQKNRATMQRQPAGTLLDATDVAEKAQSFTFQVSCERAARASTPAPQPPAQAEPTLTPDADAERALGLTTDQIRTVQLWLAALGHTPGSANGVIGPATRQALRLYQRAKGLPETGYLSTRLLAVIRLDGPPALARAPAARQFRDCPECPEMVVVPAGNAALASGLSVTIARPFAVGKFEVTFAEWDACTAQGGCSHRPDDRGWGRGRQPVMNVSWDDTQQYVAWLSRKTGKSYRLLSEAEWEYAAQAGSGREQAAQAGANQANCTGCGSRWDGRQAAPVGSFAANAFGLHDILGNLWEWTADCWKGWISASPQDASARMTGDCSSRVLRGGSWFSIPAISRSAFRNRSTSTFRDSHIGFRVARTL
jgi:formylglycine-generating enzyme required for sulfatase activity